MLDVGGESAVGGRPPVAASRRRSRASCRSSSASPASSARSSRSTPTSPRVAEAALAAGARDRQRRLRPARPALADAVRAHRRGARDHAHARGAQAARCSTRRATTTSCADVRDFLAERMAVARAARRGAGADRARPGAGLRQDAGADGRRAAPARRPARARAARCCSRSRARTSSARSRGRAPRERGAATLAARRLGRRRGRAHRCACTTWRPPPTSSPCGPCCAASACSRPARGSPRTATREPRSSLRLRRCHCTVAGRCAQRGRTAHRPHRPKEYPCLPCSTATRSREPARRPAPARQRARRRRLPPPAQGRPDRRHHRQQGGEEAPAAGDEAAPTAARARRAAPRRGAGRRRRAPPAEVAAAAAAEVDEEPEDGAPTRTPVPRAPRPPRRPGPRPRPRHGERDRRRASRAGRGARRPHRRGRRRAARQRLRPSSASRPAEPTDDDVYVSAAQVKRCELVSGDRVGGPVRAPRRSERYPSLIRVDTINGRPADEVAEGTRFEDLPVAWPDRAPRARRRRPDGQGRRVAHAVRQGLARRSSPAPPRAGKTRAAAADRRARSPAARGSRCSWCSPACAPRRSASGREGVAPGRRRSPSPRRPTRRPRPSSRSSSRAAASPPAAATPSS